MIQTTAHMFCRRGLVKNDSQNVGRFPGASLTQERFWRRVGQAILVAEFVRALQQVIVPPLPASQSTSGFTNIRFVVIARSESKKLKQFSGEVLIGALL